MAKGETVRTLTLAKDKVAGELFLPPPGTARHAGVLVFGGAEGGMSQVYGAALLAAHGYPAVTVAYFDWPGLPPALDGIPLEYFETAGQILARQPQVADLFSREVVILGLELLPTLPDQVSERGDRVSGRDRLDDQLSREFDLVARLEPDEIGRHPAPIEALIGAEQGLDVLDGLRRHVDRRPLHLHHPAPGHEHG